MTLTGGSGAASRPRARATTPSSPTWSRSALADDGRVGVIVPHGVLFRGGAEGLIRQKFIEENLLEAVIGLPANLFFGTGIPAAILIFHKGRKTTDVLFIDASREFSRTTRSRTASVPRTSRRSSAPTRSSRASPSMLTGRSGVRSSENEFNLNIPRYVDTSEVQEEIDIAALQSEIEGLETELAETRQEMQRFLKELGYAS